MSAPPVRYLGLKEEKKEEKASASKTAGDTTDDDEEEEGGTAGPEAVDELSGGSDDEGGCLSAPAPLPTSLPVVDNYLADPGHPIFGFIDDID